MKVFLSYASEDRESAEQVAASITARGHDVFFDRQSLPAGATFEDRIEGAIRGADALVFLISSHSVEAGGFALTELSIARKKWPRPGGRVLPVMLAKVDFALLPAYLKSVTVLQPEGNVPAETAIAVESMRRWRLSILKWPAIALAFITAAAMFYIYRPAPDISVIAKDPIRWERGFLDRPHRFNIMFALSNTGDRAANIVSIQLQTEPPTALNIVSRGPEPSAEKAIVIQSGSMDENHFAVTLAGDPGASFSWRICATQDTGKTNCSEQQNWAPTGNFTPDDAFQIEPKISANAVLLAAAENGFYVAMRNPHQIQYIGRDGKILGSVDLGAEPTALLAQGSDLIVGTRGPDQLVRIDPATLDVKARTNVRFPPEIRGAFDAPVSSTPVSLVRGGDRIWAVTRGGASAAGLLHFSEALTDPVVPSWFKDIAFNLDSLHLASDGQEIWGAVTNVTPASLYQLSPTAVKVFDGHDWEIASCATDILPQGDSLLVPDCKGLIQEVSVRENDLSTGAFIAAALGYKSNASIWTEIYLRRDRSGEVTAFTNNQTRDSQMSLLDTLVTRINPKEGLSLVFGVENARVIDLATNGAIVMVILDDGQGHRQTLALNADP